MAGIAIAIHVFNGHGAKSTIRNIAARLTLWLNGVQHNILLTKELCNATMCPIGNETAVSYYPILIWEVPLPSQLLVQRAREYVGLPRRLCTTSRATDLRAKASKFGSAEATEEDTGKRHNLFKWSLTTLNAIYLKLLNMWKAPKMNALDGHGKFPLNGCGRLLWAQPTIFMYKYCTRI